MPPLFSSLNVLPPFSFKAFRMFDRAATGRICFAGFAAALAKLGLHVDPSRAQSTFERHCGNSTDATKLKLASGGDSDDGDLSSMSFKQFSESIMSRAIQPPSTVQVHSHIHTFTHSHIHTFTSQRRGVCSALCFLVLDV